MKIFFPFIFFDDLGICNYCKNYKQSKKKKSIDWEERERELIKLCDKYRSNNGSYDCLIPGSGGKDSFYATHILKYKYKIPSQINIFDLKLIL